MWVEIPCVDNVGSCNYQFSNLASGTSIVLVDGTQSWFTDGEFTIREVSPPGWMLDSVTAIGADSLMFDRDESSAYFKFGLSDLEAGQLTLHNINAVPLPGTLALLALGLGMLKTACRRCTWPQ